MKTKRLGLKSISLVLAFTMLLSDVLHAAPAEGFSPSTPLETLLQNPKKFEAPLDFSLLKEVHQGSRKTFIIHIQDAHSNLSGQQNLASTLDELMDRYKVSLVLVEGGTRDDSLTELKKLAKPAVWKKVAKKFLMEGTLSGEEYLNLTSEHPMKIMGIEDKDLYRSSLEAYDKLSSRREAILLESKKVRNALEKLKKKNYPKELLEYEALEEPARRTEDLNFEERFEKLVALAGKNENLAPILKSFPNIQALSDIKARERGIDFDAANLEQAALIEAVSKKGGKERLKEALAKLSKIKNSRLSQLNYAESLLKAARQQQLPLNGYPNLSLYTDYLRGFLGIDFETLFDELERLEDEVYRASLPKGDARLIRSIDRYLGLLDSAYRIQMTTKEFQLFQANEPDFATAAYLAFINRKLADAGYFEDLIPMEDIFEESKSALVEFYESVSRRDEAFMRNTDRILKDERQEIAVLIAGGYHSSNLKKLLGGAGYSYAVLAPMVTSETNQEKYERILLEPVRKKTITVESVSGEAAAGRRSLSALEEDLQNLKRKSDGARAAALAESGSRLTRVLEAVAGSGPGDSEAVAGAALTLALGPKKAALGEVKGIEGSRLSDISETEVFSELERALAEKSSDAPRVLLIDGLPGAGKSTLAEKFREHLIKKGQPVEIVPVDRFKRRLGFVERMWRNIRTFSLWASPGRAMQIHLEMEVDREGVAKELARIRSLPAGTIALVEGMYAEALFGQLPNSVKLLLDTDVAVRKRSVAERLLKRGLSPILVFLRFLFFRVGNVSKGFLEQRPKFDLILDLSDRLHPVWIKKSASGGRLRGADVSAALSEPIRVEREGMRVHVRTENQKNGTSFELSPTPARRVWIFYAWLYAWFRSWRSEKSFYEEFFESLKSRAPPKHLLLVFDFWPNVAMGDTIVIYDAMIQILQRTYPGTKITVVIARPELWEGRDLGFDIIDQKEFLGLYDPDPEALSGNIESLKRQLGIDAAIDFSYRKYSKWQAALQKAFPDFLVLMNTRKGMLQKFGNETVTGPWVAYDTDAAFSRFSGGNIKEFMDQLVLRVTGRPAEGPRGRFLTVSEEDRKALEKQIQPEEKVLFINIFSSTTWRDWRNPSQLKEFVSRVVREKDRRVVFPAPMDEEQRRFMEELLSKLPMDVRDKVTVFRPTIGNRLHSLKLILDRADEIVTVDTGVSHLAVALGKDPIVLTAHYYYRLRTLFGKSLLWLPSLRTQKDKRYIYNSQAQSYSPDEILNKLKSSAGSRLTKRAGRPAMLLLLAGGQGKRMGLSPDQTKVLVSVAGKPLMQHVLDAGKKAGLAVVVMVSKWTGQKIAESGVLQGERTVRQPDRNGVLGAPSSRALLKGFSGDVVMASADLAVKDPDFVKEVLENSPRSAWWTMVSVEVSDPGRRPRVVRLKNGRVWNIVDRDMIDELGEHGTLTDTDGTQWTAKQLNEIKEIITGVDVVRSWVYRTALTFYRFARAFSFLKRPGFFHSAIRARFFSNEWMFRTGLTDVYKLKEMDAVLNVNRPEQRTRAEELIAGSAAGSRLSRNSTLLTRELTDAMVTIAGDSIREFLSELALHLEDSAHGPFSDIADITELWEAARQFKADPDLFSNEKLQARQVPDVPRIEMRGWDVSTGRAAQVGIIGIPGKHRDPTLQRIRALPGIERTVIRVGKRMRIELKVKGVDKALAVDYVNNHFDLLLDAIRYKPGTLIDARKTRTVMFVDANGTLYEASDEAVYPPLSESVAREAFLAHLEKGGFVVLLTGGSLERTVGRLLEGNSLPKHLRSRLIIMANGCANMNYLDEQGNIHEITAYRDNALSEWKPGKINGLDAIFLSDNAKPDGDDFLVGNKLGFDRFISVSNDPKIARELQPLHAGRGVQGAAAVFREATKVARARPNEPIFTKQNLRGLVRRARRPERPAMMVVMAGGKGTRMKLFGNGLKLLVSVWGKPLLRHVLDMAAEAGLPAVVVTSQWTHNRLAQSGVIRGEKLVQEKLTERGIVLPPKSRDILGDFSGDVVIANGDLAVREPSAMMEALKRRPRRAWWTIVTVDVSDPKDRPRVVRTRSGDFFTVISQGDIDRLRRFGKTLLVDGREVSVDELEAIHETLAGIDIVPSWFYRLVLYLGPLLNWAVHKVRTWGKNPAEHTRRSFHPAMRTAVSTLGLAEIYKLEETDVILNINTPEHLAEVGDVGAVGARLTASSAPEMFIAGSDEELGTKFVERFVNLVRGALANNRQEVFTIALPGDVPEGFRKLLTDPALHKKLYPREWKKIRLFVEGDTAWLEKIPKVRRPAYQTILPGGEESFDLMITGLENGATHFSGLSLEASRKMVLISGKGKRKLLMDLLRSPDPSLADPGIEWMATLPALSWEQIEFERKGDLRTTADFRQGTDPDGPVIILVHGMAGEGSFEMQLADLPASHTVIALHRTPQPPGVELSPNELLTFYAEDIAAAVRHFGAKPERKIVLVSHSAGGAIVDSFYAAKGEPYAVERRRVNGLILAHPFTKSTRTRAVQEVVKYLMSKEYRQSGWIGFSVQALIWILYRKEISEDWVAPMESSKEMPWWVKDGLSWLRWSVVRWILMRTKNPMKVVAGHLADDVDGALAKAGIPALLRAANRRAFEEARINDLPDELFAILHYKAKVERLAERLQEAGAPVLVVAGKRDVLVHDGHVEKFAKDIGAEFRGIGGTNPVSTMGGHQTQLVYSKEWNEMLAGFVERLPDPVAGSAQGSRLTKSGNVSTPFVEALGLQGPDAVQIFKDREWPVKELKSYGGRRAIFSTLLKVPNTHILHQLLGDSHIETESGYSQYLLLSNQRGELIAILPSYPPAFEGKGKVLFLAPFNVAAAELNIFRETSERRKLAGKMVRNITEAREDIEVFMKASQMRAQMDPAVYTAPYYRMVKFDPNALNVHARTVTMNDWAAPLNRFSWQVWPVDTAYLIPVFPGLSHPPFGDSQQMTAVYRVFHFNAIGSIPLPKSVLDTDTNGDALAVAYVRAVHEGRGSELKFYGSGTPLGVANALAIRNILGLDEQQMDIRVGGPDVFGIKFGVILSGVLIPELTGLLAPQGKILPGPVGSHISVSGRFAAIASVVTLSGAALFYLGAFAVFSNPFVSFLVQIGMFIFFTGLSDILSQLALGEKVDWRRAAFTAGVGGTFMAIVTIGGFYLINLLLPHTASFTGFRLLDWLLVGSIRALAVFPVAALRGRIYEKFTGEEDGHEKQFESYWVSRWPSFLKNFLIQMFVPIEISAAADALAMQYLQLFHSWAVHKEGFMVRNAEYRKSRLFLMAYFFIGLYLWVARSLFGVYRAPMAFEAGDEEDDRAAGSRLGRPPLQQVKDAAEDLFEDVLPDKGVDLEGLDTNRDVVEHVALRVKEAYLRTYDDVVKADSKVRMMNPQEFDGVIDAAVAMYGDEWDLAAAEHKLLEIDHAYRTAMLKAGLFADPKDKAEVSELLQQHLKSEFNELAPWQQRRQVAKIINRIETRMWRSKHDRAMAYMYIIRLIEAKDMELVAGMVGPFVLSLGVQALPALDWVIEEKRRFLEKTEDEDHRDLKTVVEWREQIENRVLGIRGSRLATGVYIKRHPVSDLVRRYQRVYNPDAEELAKFENMVHEASKTYAQSVGHFTGPYERALRSLIFLMDWRQEPELLEAAFYYPLFEMGRTDLVPDAGAKLERYKKIRELMAFRFEGQIDRKDDRTIPNVMNWVAQKSGDRKTFVMAASLKLAAYLQLKDSDAKEDIKNNAARELFLVYATLAFRRHYTAVGEGIKSAFYRAHRPRPYFNVTAKTIERLASTPEDLAQLRALTARKEEWRSQPDRDPEVLEQLLDEIEAMSARVRPAAEAALARTALSLEKEFRTYLKARGVDGADTAALKISYRVKSDPSIFEKVDLRENDIDEVKKIRDLLGVMVVVEERYKALFIDFIRSETWSGQKAMKTENLEAVFKGDEWRLVFRGRFMGSEERHEVGMEISVMNEAQLVTYRYRGEDGKEQHFLFSIKRVVPYLLKEDITARFRWTHAPTGDVDGDFFAGLRDPDGHRYVPVYSRGQDDQPMEQMRMLEVSADATIADLLVLADRAPPEVFYELPNGEKGSLSLEDLARPINKGFFEGAAFYLAKNKKQSLRAWLKSYRSAFFGIPVTMPATLLRWVDLFGLKGGHKVITEREILRSHVSVFLTQVKDGRYVTDALPTSRTVGSLREDLDSFALDQGFRNTGDLLRILSEGLMPMDYFLRDFEAYVSSQRDVLPPLKVSPKGTLRKEVDYVPAPAFAEAEAAASTRAGEIRSQMTSALEELDAYSDGAVPLEYFSGWLTKRFPSMKKSEIDAFAQVLKAQYQKQWDNVRDLSYKAYLPEPDRQILMRAYRLAFVAHQFFPAREGKQYRRIGGQNIPYIVHPVGVAETLVAQFGPIMDGQPQFEIGLEGVVAALLHDVLEDTELRLYPETELNKLLGHKNYLPWRMVRYLSKKDGVADADFYRQVLHSIEQEPDRYAFLRYYHQILLIKLADRLNSTQLDLDLVDDGLLGRMNKKELKKLFRDMFGYLRSRHAFAKNYANFLRRTDHPLLQRAADLYIKNLYEIEAKQIERAKKLRIGREVLAEFDKPEESTELKRLSSDPPVWVAKGAFGKGEFMVREQTLMERGKYFDEFWEMLHSAYLPLWPQEWLRDPAATFERLKRTERPIRTVLIFAKDEKGEFTVLAGGYVYHEYYNNFEAIAVKKEYRGKGATHVLVQDLRERFLLPGWTRKTWWKAFVKTFHVDLWAALTAFRNEERWTIVWQGMKDLVSRRRDWVRASTLPPSAEYLGKADSRGYYLFSINDLEKWLNIGPTKVVAGSRISGKSRQNSQRQMIRTKLERPNPYRDDSLWTRQDLAYQIGADEIDIRSDLQHMGLSASPRLVDESMDESLEVPVSRRGLRGLSVLNSNAAAVRINEEIERAAAGFKKANDGRSPFEISVRGVVFRRKIFNRSQGWVFQRSDLADLDAAFDLRLYPGLAADVVGISRSSLERHSVVNARDTADRINAAIRLVLYEHRRQHPGEVDPTSVTIAGVALYRVWSSNKVLWAFKRPVDDTAFRETVRALLEASPKRQRSAFVLEMETKFEQLAGDKDALGDEGEEIYDHLRMAIGRAVTAHYSEAKAKNPVLKMIRAASYLPKGQLTAFFDKQFPERAKGSAGSRLVTEDEMRKVDEEAVLIRRRLMEAFLLEMWAYPLGDFADVANKFIRSEFPKSHLRYLNHGNEVVVFTSDEYQNLVFKLPKNGRDTEYRDRYADRLAGMLSMSGIPEARAKKMIDGWALTDLPGIAPTFITEQGLIVQEKVEMLATGFELVNDLLNDERRVLRSKILSAGGDYWDLKPANEGRLKDGTLVLVDLGGVRLKTESGSRVAGGKATTLGEWIHKNTLASIPARALFEDYWQTQNPRQLKRALHVSVDGTDIGIKDGKTVQVVENGVSREIDWQDYPILADARISIQHDDFRSGSRIAGQKIHFRPGDKIGPSEDPERYLVEDILSIDGATATLYKVTDRRDGKTYALKTNVARHDEIDENEDDILRHERYLKDEAGFLRQISASPISAGAKALFPAYHDEGQYSFHVHFLVMSLFEGQSLRYAENLSNEEKLFVVMEVLRALISLHSLGIIHNDIKPMNIMFRRSAEGAMEVHLVDFGYSTQRSSTVVKTMFDEDQVSPEQQAKLPTDERSDIYQVGKLLELLMGGSPQLQPVIQKATAEKPEDRYALAQAMRRDLLAAFPGSKSGSRLGGSDAFTLAPLSPEDRQRLIGDKELTRLLESAAKFPGSASSTTLFSELRQKMSAESDEDLPIDLSVLTFASDEPSPFDDSIEVNTAAAYVYQPKSTLENGSKRAAVVIPSYGVGDPYPRAMALYLASKGFVVVELLIPYFDLREPERMRGMKSPQKYYQMVLETNGKGPGQKFEDVFFHDWKQSLSDLNKAVAWLGTRPDVDPARIGIAGQSKPGSLAVAAYLENDRIASLAVIAPPVDYAHTLWEGEMFNALGPAIEAQGTSQEEFSRRAVEQNEANLNEALKRSQRFASGKEARAAIFAIRNDKVVPPSQIWDLGRGIPGAWVAEIEEFPGLTKTRHLTSPRGALDPLLEGIEAVLGGSQPVVAVTAGIERLYDHVFELFPEILQDPDAVRAIREESSPRLAAIVVGQWLVRRADPTDISGAVIMALHFQRQEITDVNSALGVLDELSRIYRAAVGSRLSIENARSRLGAYAHLYDGDAGLIRLAMHSGTESLLDLYAAFGGIHNIYEWSPTDLTLSDLRRIQRALNSDPGRFRLKPNGDGLFDIAPLMSALDIGSQNRNFLESILIKDHFGYIRLATGISIQYSDAIPDLLREFGAMLAGKGIPEAADLLGVTRQGLFQHLKRHPGDLTKYGIIKREHPDIPALLAEADRQKLQGLSVREAAEFIGVSFEGLRSHLKRHPADSLVYGFVQTKPSDIPQLLMDSGPALKGLNYSEAAALMGVSESGLSVHLRKNPGDIAAYGLVKSSSKINKRLGQRGKEELEGLNIKQVAQLIGVNYQSLSRYFQRNPDELIRYGIAKGANPATQDAGSRLVSADPGVVIVGVGGKAIGRRKLEPGADGRPVLRLGPGEHLQSLQQLEQLGAIRIEGRMMKQGYLPKIVWGQQRALKFAKHAQQAFALDIEEGWPRRITFEDGKTEQILTIRHAVSGRILDIHTGTIYREPFEALSNAIIEVMIKPQGHLILGGGPPRPDGSYASGTKKWTRFADKRFYGKKALVYASRGVVTRVEVPELGYAEDFALIWSKSQNRFVTSFRGQLSETDFNLLTDDNEIIGLPLGKMGAIKLGGQTVMTLGAEYGGKKVDITDIRKIFGRTVVVATSVKTLKQVYASNGKAGNGGSFAKGELLNVYELSGPKVIQDGVLRDERGNPIRASVILAGHQVSSTGTLIMKGVVHIEEALEPFSGAEVEMRADFVGGRHEVRYLRLVKDSLGAAINGSKGLVLDLKDPSLRERVREAALQHSNRPFVVFLNEMKTEFRRMAGFLAEDPEVMESFVHAIERLTDRFGTGSNVRQAAIEMIEDAPVFHTTAYFDRRWAVGSRLAVHGSPGGVDGLLDEMQVRMSLVAAARKEPRAGLWPDNGTLTRFMDILREADRFHRSGVAKAADIENFLKQAIRREPAEIQERLRFYFNSDMLSSYSGYQEPFEIVYAPWAMRSQAGIRALQGLDPETRRRAVKPNSVLVVFGADTRSPKQVVLEDVQDLQYLAAPNTPGGNDLLYYKNGNGNSFLFDEGGREYAVLRTRTFVATGFDMVDILVSLPGGTEAPISFTTSGYVDRSSGSRVAKAYSDQDYTLRRGDRLPDSVTAHTDSLIRFFESEGVPFAAQAVVNLAKMKEGALAMTVRWGVLTEAEAEALAGLRSDIPSVAARSADALRNTDLARRLREVISAYPENQRDSLLMRMIPMSEIQKYLDRGVPQHFVYRALDRRPALLYRLDETLAAIDRLQATVNNPTFAWWVMINQGSEAERWAKDASIIVEGLKAHSMNESIAWKFLVDRGLRSGNELLASMKKVSGSRVAVTQLVTPLNFAQFYGARLVSAVAATPQGPVAIPYLEGAAIVFVTPDSVKEMERGSRIARPQFLIRDLIETRSEQDMADEYRRLFERGERALAFTPQTDVVLVRKIDSAVEGPHVERILNVLKERLGKHVFFEFYDRATGKRLPLSDAAVPAGAQKVLLGEPAEAEEAAQKGWRFVSTEAADPQGEEAGFLPLATAFMTAVVVGRVDSILGNSVLMNYFTDVTDTTFTQEQYHLLVNPVAGQLDFYSRYSVKNIARLAIDRILAAAEMALEAVGMAA